MSTKKLWGGRFEESAAAWIDQFGASISFDQLMANEDIEGSLAHVKMLNETGILTEQEATEIENGLLSLKDDLSAGKLEFSDQNEDIHMNIESLLTEKIGPVAGKLHTARSRNDQVATDFHLYVKKRTTAVISELKKLQKALVEKAEANVETIMPGYTHMQHAQPISYAHYLLAYFEMFKRDVERFEFNQKHTDVSPLGSCALAGTTWPIDRFFTAKELGFADVYANSLDAVSDRDFLLDLIYACSVSCLHLSRLCEEIVLWSSSEFGFITLSDSYSTGSSIMPQKKNPDFAELIRGKSGRVYGNLVQLLVTMKGLPLAYNKDLQEDKEGALDTAHTLMQCLSVMAGMISTWTVNEDAMARECGVGHLAATDVADYLAKRGLPFREAHAVVGHLVLMCEKRGCNLEDLPFEVFQEASPLFERDITEALDIPSIVAARTTEGGTAPAAVAVQLQRAEAQLVADEDVVGSLTKVVEMGHGAN